MHFNPSLPLQEILNSRVIYIQSIWFLLILLTFYQQDVLPVFVAQSKFLQWKHYKLSVICTVPLLTVQFTEQRQRSCLPSPLHKRRSSQDWNLILERRCMPQLDHWPKLSPSQLGPWARAIPRASPLSSNGSGLLQLSCLLACFLWTREACGGRVLSRRRGLLSPWMATSLFRLHHLCVTC